MAFTYRDFYRIKKLKNLLTNLAFFSLLLDLAIAFSTLATTYFKKYNFSLIQEIFDYALTAEVIITIIVFILLVVIRHYQEFIDNIATIKNTFKSKQKGKS